MMMKRTRAYCARARVDLITLFFAALLACSLLVLPMLAERDRSDAGAAEIDSGTRQCEEDYTVCRLACNLDRSCLEACLQAYNACRRRTVPGR